MELTKEQIQSIENRLEKNGLKYWDIRIEILDHLVSDIENRMENGESYNSAIENSFFYMNLNGNLEALNDSKLMTINKIIRAQYFKKIKQLLTNPSSIFVILFAILGYFLLFKFTNVFIFKTTAITILIAPMIIGVILYLKEFLQIKKSAYLNYSSFYMCFSFLFSNFFIQFSKPDGIYFQNSEESHLIFLFVITSINSIFTTAGILVYLKTVKKLKIIKEKLFFE